MSAHAAAAAQASAADGSSTIMAAVARGALDPAAAKAAAQVAVQGSQAAHLATVAQAPPGAAGEIRPLVIVDAFVYHGGGRFEDERGFYEEVEVQASEEPVVLQSGYACSGRNVVRGMHCSPYGKIVVCLAGEMFDVLVDLRPESETFMRWDALTLSPERRSRVYVPPGVGHGYMSMADGTVSLYLKLGRYDKPKEIEVNVLDPQLALPWPRPLDGAPDYIISAKDRGLPFANEALVRAQALGGALCKL